MSSLRFFAIFIAPAPRAKPPSTCKALPVMKEAAGESKKPMTVAISVGSAMRAVRLSSEESSFGCAPLCCPHAGSNRITQIFQALANALRLPMVIFIPTGILNNRPSRLRSFVNRAIPLVRASRGELMVTGLPSRRSCLLRAHDHRYHEESRYALNQANRQAQEFHLPRLKS